MFNHKRIKDKKILHRLGRIILTDAFLNCLNEREGLTLYSKNFNLKIKL